VPHDRSTSTGPAPATPMHRSGPICLADMTWTSPTSMLRLRLQDRRDGPIGSVELQAEYECLRQPPSGNQEQDETDGEQAVNAGRFQQFLFRVRPVEFKRQNSPRHGRKDSSHDEHAKRKPHPQRNLSGKGGIIPGQSGSNQQNAQYDAQGVEECQSGEPSMSHGEAPFSSLPQCGGLMFPTSVAVSPS
jgi:hypothetical protein